MTKNEGEQILKSFAQPLVRLDPRNHGKSIGKGWMRAKLVSVDDAYAVVVPMGHKKEEKVELRYVKPWYSKLETTLTQPVKEYNTISDDTCKEIYRLHRIERLGLHEITKRTGVALGSVNRYSNKGAALLGEGGDIPDSYHLNKGEEKMVTLGELAGLVKPEPKKIYLRPEEPVKTESRGQASVKGERGFRQKYTDETCFNVQELYNVKNKKVDEISTIMSIPRGTIPSLLKRARKLELKQLARQRREARLGDAPEETPKKRGRPLGKKNSVTIPAPYAVNVPVVVAPPAPRVSPPPVQATTRTQDPLVVAIKDILKLPIADTHKLLAIEALTL